ncbi:hypothetical protein ACLOJK_027672, partial [Asimina triloba]
MDQGSLPKSFVAFPVFSLPGFQLHFLLQSPLLLPFSLLPLPSPFQASGFLCFPGLPYSLSLLTTPYHHLLFSHLLTFSAPISLLYSTSHLRLPYPVEIFHLRLHLSPPPPPPSRTSASYRLDLPAIEIFCLRLCICLHLSPPPSSRTSASTFISHLRLHRAPPPPTVEIFRRDLVSNASSCHRDLLAAEIRFSQLPLL